MIRWAIRNRNRFLYLFALYWSSVLSAGLLIWAIVAIHPKPSVMWPALFAVLIFVKKALVMVLYLLEQGQRLIGYWRSYRRQFPSK